MTTTEQKRLKVQIVTDNFLNKTIFDFIKDNPGLMTSEIRDKYGYKPNSNTPYLSLSTLSHYIRRLVELGLVEKRGNKYKGRLYANEKEFNRVLKLVEQI